LCVTNTFFATKETKKTGRKKSLVPMGNGSDHLRRTKVVGSNPAEPTFFAKNPHFLCNENLYLQLPVQHLSTFVASNLLFV